MTNNYTLELTHEGLNLLLRGLSQGANRKDVYDNFSKEVNILIDEILVSTGYRDKEEGEDYATR